jgi:hypothetical protein
MDQAFPIMTMEDALLEICDFVESGIFQRMLQELWETPAPMRPRFVDEVVLNPEERARRGIVVPLGMLIQRSHFLDARPTLFCVSKRLDREPWKVTVTIDNAEGRDDEFGDIEKLAERM